MSKVFAIVDGGNVEFYDTVFEKIDNIEKTDDIYLILPDDYFYFFQTEITTKRKTLQTVRAYAKTLFPNVDFVGYVRQFTPIVGYLLDKEKIERLDKSIVEKAILVTTPFLVYAQEKGDFGYVGRDICALVVDGKLKFYAFGDESTLVERLTKDVEIVKFDKKGVLEKLAKTIKNSNVKKIAMDIGNKDGTGFENWKIYRFVAVIVVCLAFVVGEGLRYASYSKEVKNAQKKLEALYKKALGDNQYTDPYGVLLYKADYSTQLNPFSLSKVLYCLSEAKNGYDLKIDYVSYSNGALKIKGSIDNYKDLLSFLNRLNGAMGRKLVVQNTSSKGGKLTFVLVGGMNE